MGVEKIGALVKKIEDLLGELGEKPTRKIVADFKLGAHQHENEPNLAHFGRSATCVTVARSPLTSAGHPELEAPNMGHP